MATLGGESWEGCGNIFLSTASSQEAKSLQKNDATFLSSSASLTQKANIGSCEEKGQSMNAWFSTWLAAENERESKDTCTFSHVCGNPSQKQLELAKAEFERRIQVESEMEVVPVLVATGVEEVWLDRTECAGVKVLFKDGNLFITVPGEVHSDVHSKAHGALFTQFQAHGLEYLMEPSIEKVTLYGGIRTNPDILVKANWPWDIHDGRSRVMIEIEDTHRSTKATRAHGYAFLAASEYHRAFISIKIFRYAHDFGVAVVMWNKGPIGAPAPVGTVLVAPAGAVVPIPPHLVPIAPYVVPIPPGPPPYYLQAAAPLVGGPAPPIVFHAAFDCGTVNLHYKSRDSFTRAAVAGELPAVPAFPAWLGALPPPAAGPSPAPWLFQIPHYDVVYKVRDTAGNLVAFPLPIHNFELDLARVVRAAQVAMH